MHCPHTQPLREAMQHSIAQLWDEAGLLTIWHHIDWTTPPGIPERWNMEWSYIGAVPNTVLPIVHDTYTTQVAREAQGLMKKTVTIIVDTAEQVWQARNTAVKQWETDNQELIQGWNSRHPHKPATTGPHKKRGRPRLPITQLKPAAQKVRRKETLLQSLTDTYGQQGAAARHRTQWQTVSKQITQAAAGAATGSTQVQKWMTVPRSTAREQMQTHTRNPPTKTHKKWRYLKKLNQRTAQDASDTAAYEVHTTSNPSNPQCDYIGCTTPAVGPAMHGQCRTDARRCNTHMMHQCRGILTGAPVKC